ncbi:cell division protein FtsX [Pararhodobacter zhoushanensis]|uniref:Cell division protein FtsX n=1 Tax=Pararhodobacter zhoushanensis TaxID=2479545 RepID=A0ABT3GWF1_9RHOB|nr:FtsX-like permease family protein [Pararhodobacter zhoushanensis]MCW1931857.1 cell division protein FtsX [Pararhodobacter zhoushanensis]
MNAVRALGGARPTPGFGDPARIVPSSGIATLLTAITAGAMAFLAVFALALSMSAGQLAQRWSSTLSQSATLRISAPPSEIAAQTAAVLEVLRTTPGIASTRVLDIDEQRALLEPWFGPDLPIESLALPRLIEIIEAPEGFDSVGLRLRLASEAPGAMLDDHTRWRRPLVQAAASLRALAWLSVALIGVMMAAMITLAAGFSLAANAQVIRVLRLVGARDAFIARAFTNRFTVLAVIGAVAGMVLGVAAFALLPVAGDSGFLTGLGFSGAGWFMPLAIPPLAGVIAWAATRTAAMRVLRQEG